ncbi:MAG: hypothetical protein LBN37_03235 [Bacteroidales bacterium]|jgi:hypothetical protein|nr:hypothetical protein [Bacteroidales bacterium]
MKTVYFQNNTPYTKDEKFKLLLNGREYKFFYPFLNVSVDDSMPMKVEIKRKWARSMVYHFEPKDDLTLRVIWNKKIQNRGLILGVSLWVILVVIGIVFSSAKGLIGIAGGVPIFTLFIYSVIKRKSYFTIEEVSK